MLRSVILPSTVVLTLLLMVGLFFFIRASVKDRTQEAQWLANQPEDVVLSQVETYLTQRAYRFIRLDRDQDQAIFEGIVRPSMALAIFLSTLVALGLLCLGLVLAILLPQVGLGFTGLLGLSPLAGWFYWQRAQRPEQVALKLGPIPVSTSMMPSESETQTLLTVTAHRDELRAMQSALKFPQFNAAG